MTKLLHSNAKGQRCLLLVFVLTMFYGIIQAQTPDPFTYSENGSSYSCKQDNEKEGCKIGFTQEGDLFFFCLDLNLNYADKSDAIREFPRGEQTLVSMGLIFEVDKVLTTLAAGERFGQIIKIKSRISQFEDLDDTEVDMETVLKALINNSINEIHVGWGNAEVGTSILTWKLNGFKTAPTINAMLQRIVQEQKKQGDANANANNEGNNLSKVAWRNQMRKVLDYATHNYNNGDKYKGQVSTVNGRQTRQGLGLYWYNSDYIYWGAFVNGILNGYAIDIAAVGKDVDYCPNCVYFVGYYCDRLKCGKGKCYDKDGNLIYYGDFSDNRPTGTYPSTEKYMSNKFECIEYKSGDKYVGETYKGQRHGQGIYLWKNGDAWYGSWKDGTRDGYGIYLYYKGDVKYGYSKD